MANRAVPLVEWGFACAALPGQAESGDRQVVEEFPGGVLAAAIDGVGHGRQAAHAADLAAELLRRRANEPVVSLLKACHEALKQTRGAVISLASFRAEDDTMTWLGVGNVDGVLVRTRGRGGPAVAGPSVLQLSGLLGFRLPPLHASIASVRPGDTLILTTDGIRSDFPRELSAAESPQRIAERICSRHNKGTDDALVLVVRYLGKRS